MTRPSTYTDAGTAENNPETGTRSAGRFDFTRDDSREINADPEEVESLRRSRQQYDEKGDADCLGNDESVADTIDS